MEIEVTLLSEHIGELITLHGSIYKIRKMSGFSFIILRTARYTVQCVCDRQEILCGLQEEACVELTAKVVKEERAKTGVELHITAATILSRPTAQMPIVMNQKRIEASLENKLDYRPLTLRNEKERAVFKLQEGLLRGFRRFFQAEGFTEIHSPKIVYAGAEGGANIFKLDYFGREAYLAQSPQFYKQMMVGVFERVYEAGPVFRAEKHDTARHLNEYTGVDFEMGYIHSFRELMEAEVRMLRTAFELLQEEYAYELELLQVKLPTGMTKEMDKDMVEGLHGAGVAGESQPGAAGESYSGETGELQPGAVAELHPGAAGAGNFAIPALKFSEAKALLKEYGREAEQTEEAEGGTDVTCGRQAAQTGREKESHDFDPEEEKALSEIIFRETGSEFVFVTHYPSDKRPFYAMDDPENPEETLSFDLLFRGLEITTGGQRIHDYEMQVEKMRSRGMNPEAFASYLMMHKHGMPPHGGLGIGLERLTARLLGFDNVRQASLFPRDIHRLEP
ncbi:MAG: OB-fold nucleic acid binding domain-containing protein [Butyrivibrio sp.]|nr:OB-fold nucleic acid binding domain-containing protein [Acetatifactor muris]MCM1560113.1 OB-fold nucleic acid binding domain-containing protein [Butyrivibrio sp.]